MHSSLLLYLIHLTVNKKVAIYTNTDFKEYLSHSLFLSHCLSPDVVIPDRNNLQTTGSNRKLFHLMFIGSQFDHTIFSINPGHNANACTQKQYNDNYRHDQETIKQLKLVKRKEAQRSELTRELGNNKFSTN